MINFRFHLVSLIAVFLALGLGILVGSTVIDQGIVNRLDTEIHSVRKEIDDRNATNSQLSKQNSQLQQFIAKSAAFAGDGRLDCCSVAVVAERGVDTGVVKQTEQALQLAGADVPAVLWLEDGWQLDTDSRLSSLQSAVGVTGSASVSRTAAFNLLAQRLAQAPGSGRSTSSTTTPRSTTKSTPESTPRSKPRSTTSTTTTVPPAPSVDALTALEQAGFLKVTDGHASDFADFPARPVNVLVITGDDSDFAGSDLTSSFVSALVHLKLPAVVAAEYDAGGDAATAPKRGAALSSVLDDNVLSSSVSTVDDLELPQGRVATVLSLGIIGSGSVGHYGYGLKASGPLPPHPSS